MRNAQFEIGMKFSRKVGKRTQEETIVDIYTTTNGKGEVVRICYACAHEYMGQMVVDHDVCQATIARAVL